MTTGTGRRARVGEGEAAGAGGALEERIERLARRARAASREVARLPGSARTLALEAISRRLLERAASVLEANRRDLEAAEAAGLPPALVDRLRLDAGRVEGLASAVRGVARLPDPVGEVVERSERPNGLRVERVRIPLGVIAMIYESRPNVTADAAALCFKAGNAVILRGGSEAFRSNRAIAEAIRDALEEEGVPPDAVQLLDTTDRRAVDVLLRQDRWIDLVIPRGGEGLIRTVVEKSRIPVLKHYKGVCHIFIDRRAEPGMAGAIVENAKVQRPGVCNAVETVLVHRAWARRNLPALAARLQEAGVELRGCPEASAVAPDAFLPATEGDWEAEYLAPILAVRVVESLDEAVEHIERFGSDHTEAIVTSEPERGREFVARVPSSTVLVNASTRFADGGELGLGAEIGISTSRLHAYGPMGARELTATRFTVYGEGQVRG